MCAAAESPNLIPQSSARPASLQVRGVILTDPGRQRTENEDWCGSLDADDLQGAVSVWVIADGVSHYGTGRDAARLAVETFLAAGWEHPDAEPDRVLEDAALRADHLLRERAQPTGQMAARPHAATIVAAAVRDAETWILAAGDCRAYLLRGGTIRQITRDHTVAAEAVRQGQLRPEAVATHPGRHTITRCLGARTAVQPDLFHERLQAGDVLLLCSDGLTRDVADEEIRRIAVASEPAVAARQLVDLANRHGGADNITVGILRLVATPEASMSRAAGPAAPADGRRGERDREPPPPTPVRPTPHAAVSVDRLAVLRTMGQRINASLELPATLSSVLDSLVEITGAERACIMLRDLQSGELVFRAGRNLDASGVASDPVGSRNIVARVFQDGEPLLIGDAISDPSFRAFESIVAQAVRSVICAPLTVRERSIGVVYVDTRISAGLFTQSDLDLVLAFATMAASAIENANLRTQLEAQVREISAMKTTQDRILRSVGSGIIAVDPLGTITNCNRAAAEMLLVDAEAIVGQPLGRVLPPPFMLALGAPFGGDAARPSATVHGIEMVGELRGRGYVHFEHRLSPLHDEAGKTVGYVIALEDRTFLARLERERQEAGAERERLMRIFSGMMSPDVLQEVLRIGGEGSGFSGDRRDLTVMFADIRGFTGMSERLEPESVVELLNECLGAATDVILEHKGSIDKYIGDAVMALFGAPAPLENHALQAVRAALAMQRRFAEMPARDGHRVTFGIGINTGAGVVGMIGSPNVKSYTAIGDVVNVAARLQGEARAGEVLITDATHGLVAEHVTTEGLGSIYVKGRVTPVSIFKVMGLRG